MSASGFVDLMRKVTDADPRVRERGSEEVTDWPSAYSPAEAAALATTLSAVAASERDHSALEAQLHAILELTSTGHVQVDHLLHLRDIDLQELPSELQGYVTDLLEG
ncbi:hypothetical protein AQJ23_06795 [Streptomyces antibioticus]|nr:hypothetical protein [Streptomyces antibioticus]KUN28639.1 hypothetical protein AQJ23_06795 [Streptomyces antibioticus]